MNNNNLIEEVSNIKATAVFSKDRKNRYLLRFDWDDSKKSAVIIMTYPSTADSYKTDQTTMLVRNNAIGLDFGSIAIVNVFCGLELKTPKTDRINASVIAEQCEKADIIIVAYGRGASHTEEKENLLNTLKESFAKKLYTIEDSSGQIFSHPLSPKAREWQLVKLKI